MSLKIYLAHPISGLTYDEVIGYYKKISRKLKKIGYEVFHPMTGKSAMRTDIKERFQPIDNKSEIATNHAIISRDTWMVRMCDILYLDLTGTQTISIGCVMELFGAYVLGKYTVVVMEKDNVHRHAFVVEAAGVIFEESKKALDYLKVLKEQTI